MNSCVRRKVVAGVVLAFALEASSAPPVQRIESDALIELPSSALWSQVVNFRPGDRETVHTNPPRFSWAYSPRPAESDADISLKEFRFQVAYDREFKDLAVDVRTDSNLYNFIAPFERRTCAWRVGYIDPEKGDAPYARSEVRSFTIAEGATVWDRSMLADEKYLADKGRHPHMLFNERNRQALREYLEAHAVESWGMIRKQADHAIAQPWWTAAPDPRSSYQDEAAGIGAVAFVWQLTRERKYLDARPQEALVRMARHYIASGRWHGDTVSGTSPYIIRNLGFGYDWLYEAMTAEQRREVLRAIEANCEFVRNVWWWRSPKKPISFEMGEPADPFGIYDGGFVVESWSGSKMPSGHPMINFYMAMTAALAAYPESARIREFLDLGLHYLIGKTVPFGGEGGINQGRPYGFEDVFATGTALPLSILCQIALPEARFDLNPFWRVNADWWSRMIPVGFTQGHEPWGDTGWGGIRIWGIDAVGKSLALFAGDGVAFRHWKEARPFYHAYRHPDTAEYAVIPFHFQAPSPKENEILARVYPVEGWVIGATYPSNTEACFNEGVGFVFQARPSGSECIAHSHFGSDLSFQIWAYGAAVTDAGSGMTPYGKSSMCHYSLLVDGFGQFVARHPTEPYYSRIFAFRETPDYTYCAGDGTDAYPRTKREPGGWLIPRRCAEIHASGPLSHLKRVHRHILFVRKKYFVMLDDLETDKPARFTWLYHIPWLYRVRPDARIPKYEAPADDQVERVDTLELDAGRASFRYACGNVYPRVELPGSIVTVPVHVAHIARPSDLEVTDLAGEKVCSNPFTGEDYLQESDPYRRAHALWVTNKTAEKRFHFLTVIYPQKPLAPAPEIERLDDFTVRVSCGGRKDVISFDPRTRHPATIVVDLPAMVPIPASE